MIKSTLKFRPDYTAREGTIEIYNALKDGKVTDSLKTKTVEWYKHLLDADAISKEVTIRGIVL